MICLRTFHLHKIDLLEHYSFIQSLNRDVDVSKYVSGHFSEWLMKQQSISDDVMEIGKSYVVEKNGQYIGIVGSLKFSIDGVLDVWYVIEKNFRRMGYGEKVLAEITSYFIEHIDGLNDIRLRIDETNQGSKRVALLNGYLEDESERKNGVGSYYYFGYQHKQGKRGSR